jgi:lysophospholipase L1-like esterase
MRLVTLGDSHTAPFNLCGPGWPTVLTRPVTHNAGIGGDQTHQMLARLSTDVLAYDPTDVAIMGGTNDIDATRPLVDILAYLGAIIDAVQAGGANAWLLTIPPNTTYPSEVAALNAALPALAAAHGAHLIDVAALLTPWSTFSCEGIHANAQGAALIAFVTQQAIQPSDFLILPDDAEGLGPIRS